MFSITLLLITTFAINSVLLQSCPNIQPVTDFNLTKFRPGGWYCVARYESPIFGDDPQCVTGSWTIKADSIYTTIRSVADGNPQIYRGVVTAIDSGKLLHLLTTDDEITLRLRHDVLSTDYTTYVIFYHCQLNEETGVIQESAWLLVNDFNGCGTVVGNNTLKNIDFINYDKLIWSTFNEDICKTQRPFLASEDAC